MTCFTHKFAVAMVLLLFPHFAAARPQYHQSPTDLADEQQKAREEARKAWAEQCGAAFEAAHPGRGLYFLTGPETGYYWKVGKAITTVVAENTSHNDGPPLEIEPIVTGQTTCNLLGLEAGKVAFALVQSDIAHDAWFGHPPVRRAPAQDITLVSPLFVEAVHIVTRPHLNLAQLSDLRGRRVWLGTENSLTVLTASRILEAAGLTSRDIAALDGRTDQKTCPKPAICQWSSAEALKALRRLDLDAVFQVGSVPFDSLHDAILPTDSDGQLLDAERNKKPCDAVRKARLNEPTLLDSELHLFNLDVNLVERLVADGSYIEQLIPPYGYCQQSATLTVGVRALLLTNLGGSDPVVTRLASVLNLHQREIETNLRQQMEVLQKSHGDPITGNPSRLSLLRVPTPPLLAVRYHPTIPGGKIYFNPAKELAENLAAAAGGLAIAFLALYRFRRFVGPWLARRGGLAAGLAAPVLLWVATSVMLKNLEGSVNEDFNTLFKSLLSTFEELLTYLTFGTFGTLGNAPVTQTGQTALNWSGRIFVAACGLLLVPAFLRSWWPKSWAIAKNWLMCLGHPRVPSPSPASFASAAATPTADSPGAPDHGVPFHPTP